MEAVPTTYQESDQKKLPLGLIVTVIACVALLHFLGLYFYFYWRIPWYDRIVHTLGGFWISLMTFSFFHYIYFRFKRISSVILIGLLTSLLIGILWEIFELKTGITVMTDYGYVHDTTGDIISDIVGGMIGILYAMNTKLVVWKIPE